MSRKPDVFVDVVAGVVSAFLGAAAIFAGLIFAIATGFWPGWIVAAAGLATIYYGLYRLTR